MLPDRPSVLYQGTTQRHKDTAKSKKQKANGKGNQGASSHGD